MENTPTKGEATYWEDIINNDDYDTFFESMVLEKGDTAHHALRGSEPMPKNYLHLVYGYTVCCGDRKKLTAWLNDPELQLNPEVHVFKKITASDEAWTVANLVNNYDGWCEKFDNRGNLTHVIHKKSLGKWTSLTRNSTEGGIRQDGCRRFAKSGWHKDGVEFYNRAAHFFKRARLDPRFKDVIQRARDMYFDDLDGQKSKGNKRKWGDGDGEESARVAPTMDWGDDAEINTVQNYTAI